MGNFAFLSEGGNSLLEPQTDCAFSSNQLRAFLGFCSYKSAHPYPSRVYAGNQSSATSESVAYRVYSSTRQTRPPLSGPLLLLSEAVRAFPIERVV